MPGEPGKSGSEFWRHAWICAALIAINFLFYFRTVQLGFLSVDDPDYVQNNPLIEKFSAANLKRIFSEPYSANFAPANLLSYSVDVALAGSKKASAVHLSNVIWHGLNGCAVYLLAVVAFRRWWPAAIAAALFVLHPAHVEVVAWVSSRKDLVATCFAALSMATYLLARRRLAESLPAAAAANHSAPGSPVARSRPKGKSARLPAVDRDSLPPAKSRRRPTAAWAWYGASVACFLVASAGKQSVILLPAVMWLWDWLVERRHWFSSAIDKIPFGLVTLFFGWMTWHAQPPTNQHTNLLVWAATLLTDSWLLTGLGHYTLYRVAPDASAWSLWFKAAVAGGAVVLLLAPGVFLWRKRPALAVWCYWALIQLIPPMPLNFLVPITDRYLFLPSVGACLLLAGLAAGWEERAAKVRLIGQAGALALAVVWGVQTWMCVGGWLDPRSVWHTAHLRTRNPQVFQFLGEVYQNAGDRMDAYVKTGAAPALADELRLARAVLGDELAVERLQAEWSGAGGSRTNSVAYRDRLYDEAWRLYETALANRGTLSTPNLFMTRGRLLVSRKQFARAIPEFQNALRFAENSSYQVTREEMSINALRAIGVAYWSQGKYREAQPWFYKARDRQKQSGRAWVATLDQEIQQLDRLAATSQQ